MSEQEKDKLKQPENEFLQLKDICQTYYRNYFPIDILVKWVRYDKRISSKQREWSFECLLEKNDKFVRRFVPIKNKQDFLNIVNRYGVTLKFDIGPVYNHDITHHKMRPLEPIKRELVFDIDADDFSTIRYCDRKHPDKPMCHKCWRFMECAMCIITLFNQLFGFEKYIFVFSGRRGLHCWISDLEARKMKSQNRKEMLKQFEKITVDNKNEIQIDYDSKKFIDQQIFKICECFFNIMIDSREQDWFGEYIDDTKSKIMLIYNSLVNQKQQQKDAIQNKTGLELLEYIKQIPMLYERVVIYFTYPRFDINVTKGMNHLLKAPFSLHPKTQNISIPISHYAIIKAYNLDTLLAFNPQYPSIVKRLPRFDIEKPLNYRDIKGKFTENDNNQSNNYDDADDDKGCEEEYEYEANNNKQQQQYTEEDGEELMQSDDQYENFKACVKFFEEYVNYALKDLKKKKENSLKQKEGNINQDPLQ